MITLLLSLNIDYALFMGTKDTTYCEIYWSQPYSFFEFQKEEAWSVARFNVRVIIENPEIREKNQTVIPRKMIVPSVEDAKARNASAVDVIPLFLLKGYTYKITVILVDSLTHKTDSASVDITPPEWSGLKLSSIQLSHTIRESNASHPFVKNGYFIVPYPEREFSRNSYLMGYYVEIYNVRGESVDVKILISNDGITGNTVKEERLPNPGGSLVVAGITNLIGKPPGSYYLLIKVQDGENIVQGKKEFTVLGQVQPVFVRRIPDEQLPYAMFLNYLLSSEELQYFNGLSDSAKVIFVERFWRKRDPTPETPKNEALEEFIKRIKYADEHFSLFNIPGRSTSRGRILIKYGIPDEVINRTFVSKNYPYVIWFYHSETPKEFIFVDRAENGNYELIYSSVPDEPYDPNWESYILPEDRMNTISR